MNIVVVKNRTISSDPFRIDTIPRLVMLWRRTQIGTAYESAVIDII